jgi:hypothetical protein
LAEWELYYAAAMVVGQKGEHAAGRTYKGRLAAVGAGRQCSF